MLGGLLAIGLMLAGPLAAAEGDDDLALVKRAVDSSAARSRQETREAPREARDAGRPSEAPAPAWLKVEVVEDDAEGASLSINLPLALVRAVDALACEKKGGAGSERAKPGLADLLAGLVSGQSLVSIESDDAKVRVWVE